MDSIIRSVSRLICLVLLVGIGLTTYAADATTLAAETTTWENGDYVVPAGGLTISGHITVNGTVNLTLTEGTTLTASQGIAISDGAILNIIGKGTMAVNGTTGAVAISGPGMVIMNSGTLTAKGGAGRNDDQHATAGGNAISATMTINGGTVSATGGNGGGRLVRL